MGVIYIRPNLINGKKYVGQATNLKTRQNRWNDLNQPYAGPAINAARAKYGIEAFGFEILKECDDKELDYWEKYYVKELNTKAPYGYNLTDGGGGISGYTLSEETRKKMSEKAKGRKVTEETRKKLSENRKGKKCSEETKKKLSEIRSKTVLQIDRYTNEVIAEFPSIIQVERDFGYDKGAISKCCRGERKSAYGFIWKYKESVA